jgi:hypothetical protein
MGNGEVGRAARMLFNRTYRRFSVKRASDRLADDIIAG